MCVYQYAVPIICRGGRCQSVAIAIVDSSGNLAAFSKMDNTQHGSVDIAIGKAATANNLKRPTKALQDTIAQGGAGLRLLGVQGITPLEGGVPIVVDGRHLSPGRRGCHGRRGSGQIATK